MRIYIEGQVSSSQYKFSKDVQAITLTLDLWPSFCAAAPRNAIGRSLLTTKWKSNATKQSAYGNKMNCGETNKKRTTPGIR